MTLRWILVPFLALMVSACAPVGSYRDSDTKEDQRQTGMEPITVRVSGFGTYEDASKDRLNTRKRLLARRASQLDAYRNLAERVYGTVIYGSSTVNDFVLRNDTFRTYVDSYIRGAKMVAVNEHSDGVVETVMELKLEPRFRACVSKVADDQVQDLCPIPMPRDNDSIGDVQSRGVDSLYYLD
ncbi:LPP20 family lipoprotein [Marinobacter sediminum]|uniref:LPP20 family lipoprotein n=1 Tax=Marinobacter sediminum TaxID=256323 RepID=UPI00202F5A68|nr:LPP20 family lipoprotein [Marinobacter sediminum]MCM0613180.1 LPP20 family lipoprotein [Marinobacter sediminum]